MKEQIKKDIEEFICNKLGINLCSVETIDIDMENEQIKEISIKFIPA